MSNALPAVRGREQVACVAGNMCMLAGNMKMTLAVMQIWFLHGCSLNIFTGALPPYPLPALRLAILAGCSVPYVSPFGHPYRHAALQF